MRECTCDVFNTFVDVFRCKFLMQLDDVEKFFLWEVAALDGRNMGFDCLEPMWDNKADSTKVTKRFHALNKLKVDVEENIS